MAQYKNVWNGQTLLLVDVMKGDSFVHRFVAGTPEVAYEMGKLFAGIRVASRAKRTMIYQLKKRGWFACWCKAEHGSDAAAIHNPEVTRFVVSNVPFRC